MRRETEIDAEGTTLRGWIQEPENVSGKCPAIVMSQGFGVLKEMDLDRFADVFVAAGMIVVAYDNRNFGASDGEPRQEVDPWAQVRDFRHAITWAQEQPRIDPGRIGIWGRATREDMSWSSAQSTGGSGASWRRYR